MKQINIYPLWSKEETNNLFFQALISNCISFVYIRICRKSLFLNFRANLLK